MQVPVTFKMFDLYTGETYRKILQPFLLSVNNQVSDYPDKYDQNKREEAEK